MTPFYGARARAFTNTGVVNTAKSIAPVVLKFKSAAYFMRSSRLEVSSLHITYSFFTVQFFVTISTIYNRDDETIQTTI